MASTRTTSLASQADSYRLWAPHYPPRAHNVLMRVEEAAMLSLLPDVGGATAIDAGCGTGRYAALMLARGARQVIAVDRSMAMLRHAHCRGKAILADLANLPLDSGSVDLVVCGLVMMDVAALAPVAREWARVLKPSGSLLCSTLHPRGRALGWTRTFETPDGNGELPAHWHTVGDFERAFGAVGLAIDAVLEPPPGTSRPPWTHHGEPVALVVRARAGG